MMQRQARRDFPHTVDEIDPVVVKRPHQVRNVVDRKGMANDLLSHEPPGGEGHLAVLQIKLRLGELAHVAAMVIVHMGEDNLLDIFCLDADQA